MVDEPEEFISRESEKEEERKERCPRFEEKSSGGVLKCLKQIPYDFHCPRIWTICIKEQPNIDSYFFRFLFRLDDAIRHSSERGGAERVSQVHSESAMSRSSNRHREREKKKA